MLGKALSIAPGLLETDNTSAIIKRMESMAKPCLDPHVPTSGIPQNESMPEAGTEDLWCPPL